jgi:transketolase
MLSQFESLALNTIRFLAVDAVERANSGHPGAPMGAAGIAFVLWDKFLRHNPTDPMWPNRDRFILSAGHASMLLYAMLYLTGYDLSLEDITQFRQWKSKTPGHPEYGVTPGVEATTGPLGQGFANGVGMAIAEQFLAARYNRPGYEIIDHYTYALCSDGDLMEGVSAEAASLAGHLKLGKLIYFYDDNKVTIEGGTEATFTEDVEERFRAYGWQVLGPIDGPDLDEIAGAVCQAKANRTHPSLIICRTTLGFGSPHKAGTCAAHGEPLGKDEVSLSKAALGWTSQETFTVPPEVLGHFRQAVERGKQAQQEWQALWEHYQEVIPIEGRELATVFSGGMHPGWEEALAALPGSFTKPIATREVSGKVLNALAPRIPTLIGGSADLAPSTKTLMKGEGDFAPGSYSGRNMHFGVREHAMGAIANGMSLHGGVIPYTATFFVFYDYMRPPIRLAALMGQRVIFVFSHDSIGLGEDGPTHQPIEHLAGMRAVPNLSVIRPADAAETVEAWRLALERTCGPTALVLTRQAVPVIDRSRFAPSEGARRGGYVVWQVNEQPDVILIGTGSEVHIALEAGRLLAEKGVSARVVSLPSWDIFEAQSDEYRASVLPPAVKARVSIEAASTMGWCRYVGDRGIAIGVDRFGASAPGPLLFEKLGLTPGHVMEAAERSMRGMPG